MTTKEQAQADLDQFNAYVDANVPCGLSARVIKLMHKEAHEAMAGDGWRPIDHPDIERAKRNGAVLLGFYDDGSGVFAFRWGSYQEDPNKGGWFHMDFSDELGFEPTHWMPLPPAPKGQDDGTNQK